MKVLKELHAGVYTKMSTKCPQILMLSLSRRLPQEGPRQIRQCSPKCTRKLSKMCLVIFHMFYFHMFWEPARPLQRSLGPFGPVALGNSAKRLFRHSLETLRRLPGLFLSPFGDFWGRRPRQPFSRLFRHFGPEGPERPLTVRGGLVLF